MLAEQSARGANVASAAPALSASGFPQFAPKAKHNIVLFMPGGPSQMDLFDPKPALQKYAGQRPPSVDLRTERTTGGLMACPFEFKPPRRAGVEVNQGVPHLAPDAGERC